MNSHQSKPSTSLPGESKQRHSRRPISKKNQSHHPQVFTRPQTSKASIEETRATRRDLISLTFRLCTPGGSLIDTVCQNLWTALMEGMSSALKKKEVTYTSIERKWRRILWDMVGSPPPAVAAMASNVGNLLLSALNASPASRSTYHTVSL